MKARLLFADRDFDWSAPMPWNERALTADLSLTTLFDAMAMGDDLILEASRKVVFAGVDNDVEIITHRQAVLKDCLKNPSVVRDLYRLTHEVAEVVRGRYLGRALSRHPEWVLRHAVELMTAFIGFLKRLRATAEREDDRFASSGWKAMFASWTEDLDDEFFVRAKRELDEFRQFSGMELSAELGPANIASEYVLRRVLHGQEPTLWRRLVNWFLRPVRPPHSFDIHPLDESGVKMLDEIRKQGISVAAQALGRSSDHVFSFFVSLRQELAFYVGCLNLHDRLDGKGEPLCMPSIAPIDASRLSFQSLFDVTLALTLPGPVVGSSAAGDVRDLVVITGANQGGKSTFLRGLGVAQLMTQAGMFAPAKALDVSLCNGLFTHYKREEDVSLGAGKLDEELARASEIIDHITTRPLLLLNESFSATNEREGSEIAWQFMTALLEARARIVCVTHLYELAHRFERPASDHTLFLRAERRDDGARTFRLIEGEPLETSFGQDLYAEVFDEADAWPPHAPPLPTLSMRRLFPGADSLKAAPPPEQQLRGEDRPEATGKL